MFQKEKSPFDVNLRCDVSIEVNVAMRLGELILTSRTDDKQLLALGHRLANSMKYLADNLDDRQWEAFSDYIDEQSSDENSEGYASKARKTVGEMSSYVSNRHRIKEVSEVHKNEYHPKPQDQMDSEIQNQRDWGGWAYKENY